MSLRLVGRQYACTFYLNSSSSMVPRSHFHIRRGWRPLGTATCGSSGFSSQGRPYRVVYAFEPARAGILLLGGDKTGNDRWYEDHVPVADRLYDEHLRQLEREGLI